MAGQTVAMLTSITAITNATAVLIIIEVDVLNRISVGNILRSPKDKCIKNSGYPASGVQSKKTESGVTIHTDSLTATC